MSKINLKAYNFRTSQPDYRAGDILKRARLEQESVRAHQFSGLVTSGFIEVQQGSGSGGWAVTNLIEFPYLYFGRPVFTWGLDGTYSGNLHDADGLPLDGVHAAGGGNDYGPTLPTSLQTLIDAGDVTTWSPSIFIPRVIHWVIEGTYYTGCYILIIQLNPGSTEENKKMRLSYQFTGQGVNR